MSQEQLTGGAREERESLRLDRELLVLGGVVVIGTIMAILDATIVNVAIPILGRDLHASISTIQWVMTGYLLALTSAIPLVGVVAVLLAWRLLPDTARRRGGGLDLRGLALLSPGIAIFVYGMSEAGAAGGFGAGRALPGITLGLALVALFVWHAWRRGRAALIDLSLFRRRPGPAPARYALVWASTNAATLAATGVQSLPWKLEKLPAVQAGVPPERTSMRLSVALVARYRARVSSTLT